MARHDPAEDLLHLLLRVSRSGHDIQASFFLSDKKEASIIHTKKAIE